MSSSGSWKTEKMERDRLGFDQDRLMEHWKLVLRLVWGAGDPMGPDSETMGGCCFPVRPSASLAKNAGVFSPWRFMIL